MYPKVTALIKTLLKSDPYYKSMTPFDINRGNCEDFAMSLLEEFKGGEMLWGDEIPEEFNLSIHEPTLHCFFRYQGEDSLGETLYYDAECKEGVNFPVELPFFKRQFEVKFA